MKNLSIEELEDLLDQKRQQVAMGAIIFTELTSKGAVKNTLTNAETLIAHCGITIRHNEMTKEIEIDIPGVTIHADTAINAARGYIRSYAHQHGMPVGELDAYIATIANANAYHPVRDWINAQEWDGTDRLPDYYDTIVCGANSQHIGNTLKETLMRKWALALVASLYEPQFSMEGVLCLYGRQGIGKTSWAYGLIPRQYGNKWIKDAVALDVNNKDSVMKAVGTWITELGELDSTFKKSDLEALKAWITEKQDVIRPPYERAANKYARRTCFYATLNTLEFLNDDENRRFWVLDVDAFRFPQYDLAQFWAQIKHLYDVVAPLCQDSKSREANQEWGWFLTPTERDVLQQSQNPFRTVDPVIETLSNHIVAPQHMKTVRGENLNITEILKRCGMDRVSKRETTAGGKWLREQGFRSDRQKRFTVEIVDQTKSLPHLKVVDSI